MDENSKNIDISRIRIPTKEGITGQFGFYPYLYIIVAFFIITAIYLLFLRKDTDNSDILSSQHKQVVGNDNNSSQYSSNKISLSAAGYVVAQRSAAVSSKATGRLKELRVEEGDAVKQGDILGILENEDLQALVRERESNLELLKSSESIALAEFNEASLIRERVESLRKTKSISQAEYDAGMARHLKAIAQLELSKANIKVGQAQLEKSKIDLSYTFIVAPFDGTVLTKNADVGEIVAPFGSSANSRAAIVTIADMNSLQIEADISESNLQKISLGMECTILLDSYPDNPYKGRVVKIVPTVDRAKATVLTKIEFLNSDSKIIPEMSAKVFFNQG